MSPYRRVAHIAATALVLGCQTSKSAERQDSFGQQAASRVEEGPVKVTVLEFAAPENETGSPEEKPATLPTRLRARPLAGTWDTLPAHGPLVKAIVTERAPVVSTTQTQTTASGEAHSASAARFGWSPIAWVLGGLALLAGLWGLFRLKAKLGL